MNSLRDLWPTLISVAYVTTAIAVTVDAVLRKRHVQSIIAWVGVAWLAPIVGAIAYVLLGINRIRRAARALGIDEARVNRPPALRTDPPHAWQAWTPALAGLELLGHRVTGQPLLAGNRITPLENGDATFPRMLAAIDGAQHSVWLQTYIFDVDDVGAMFCEALGRAHRRGVSVRVLIDDVGSRYSRPTAVQRLRQYGVPVATFLPTLLPRLFRYANLRNHRKIMIVDGVLGFTGGMNIRKGHWLAQQPSHPARCLHFEIEGPVIADMQHTFATDWAFATREALAVEPSVDVTTSQGPVLARGIPDGPDEDLGKMPAVLRGALSAAQHSIDIMTPYFLPDEVLLRTIETAALRGVEVKLVLPGKSNVPLMDWAMRPQLRDLIDRGVHVYLSPLPFDHTKLFVVDGCWSLIGSTNWDARSLRLNFEYNVECYDPTLAQALQRIVVHRIAQSMRLDVAMLEHSNAVRLRNGLARLFSPYL